MRTVMISMESVCIVVQCILLYGCIREVRLRNHKNRVFMVLVLNSLVMTVIDFASWYFDGNPNRVNAMIGLSVASFIASYGIGPSFTYYQIAVLNEKTDVSMWHGRVALILFSAVTIFTVIGTPLKKIFYYDSNASFNGGDWYIYTQLYGLIITAYNIFLIAKYAKRMGRHHTLALLSFMMFPFVTLLVQCVYKDASVLNVVVMLCVLILYIMLQAQRETEFQEKEMQLMRVSRTDALTGMQNRRVYDEVCDKCGGIEYVGVVFCDINSLKYVNDHKGHKAGDELIKSVANVIKKYFREEDLFRISGDEFVVIAIDISMQLFHKRLEGLHQEFFSDGKIKAAIGTSYGRGDDLVNLIREAEHKMYQEKDMFYKAFPKYKR
ncbi:MAG: GGDEF domain-containing protein [Eubacterium sp.]|nr:GGDEF domain-containing protein [Eubacterium sp.]